MTLKAELALALGSMDLDVALEVAAGEVVALLGPNGAGKTTVLRALAGLLPLRAGRVVLDGQVLEEPTRRIRLPPEERAVGVVFQDCLLFPHLSARDNVAFGLRARGMRRHEARRRAADWLARVHLAGVDSARPSALSAGQAQRVALARALATDPVLLLLDEPLSALDAESRLAVRRELRTHLDAFTGPCLLVTHEPLEAVALADRLVILEAGRIVQAGPVDEVTQRPRSAWVAGLVGLNLFRGRARGSRIELPSGARLVAATPARGEVFAVIDPRAVALHRLRPEGSPRNVWAGSVDSLDVQGDRVRVHVGDPIPIVAEITPAAVADLDLARGGGVWVSVKATEVAIYPA
ncbi:MAG: ABC transporter ATP-binding protein [Actinomycetota bacterium]|nr:ABC transporter ATP-binding protein [Actinomycetota bacterium]